jgi:hypothetical protein
MERFMRDMTLRCGLSAAILISCAGLAAAQQPPADPGQQQRHEQMLQTVPGKNGAEEPSSHVNTTAGDPQAAFVDGKLAVPGAPQNSQTEPAKFSTRNAALDTLPTMALPLALTDEERRRIADSIAKANTPVTPISAKLADILPDDVTPSDLPREVSDIPAVKDLKYVRLPDKIVLVRAPNMVVTGEIAN